MKLSSRILGSTTALVVFSSLGYVYYKDFTDTPSYNSVAQPASKDTTTNAVEILPPRHSSSKSAVAINQSLIMESQPATPSDLLSKEEVLEMIAWQQERGYPSHSLDGEVEASPYEYYSVETLQDLADGGDPQAMLILGRKQLFESGNYDLAKSLFFEASARGYTVTLAELGNASISKANRAKQANQLAKAKEHFKDAYAWFEVGILRGDKAMGFSKSMYNVKFTSEELQEIKAVTNQYYFELATKREDLGYPPFNNDYPAALDIVYGEIFSGEK